MNTVLHVHTADIIHVHVHVCIHACIWVCPMDRHSFIMFLCISTDIKGGYIYTHTFIGSCLATKAYITGYVMVVGHHWVCLNDDERGSWANKIVTTYLIGVCEIFDATT